MVIMIEIQDKRQGLGEEIKKPVMSIFGYHAGLHFESRQWTFQVSSFPINDNLNGYLSSSDQEIQADTHKS